MKLIVLDRDGVINVDSEQFIKSPDEWKPIPGSLEAIARLNESGWRVVVASNQSGVGRGLFDMDTLNAINEKMTKAIGQAGGRLDAIFFCPHSADSTCACRKPKPGMVHEVMERFNVRGDGLPMIGDSLRDLQAVAEVGGLPLLVRTGKGLRTLEKGGLPAGTQVFDDLFDAADYLINLED